jgi:hypothetical protein
VDGSEGARLEPANGILLQMMEDDDPGPQMVNGELLNTGVYREPSSDPEKRPAFDVTVVHDDDAVATFSDIDLHGDLYNGIRGASPAGPFGPGVDGRNLVLTLDDAKLDGVISASSTRHAVDTITATDYRQLGVVTNTARPVINNGVIVTLDGRSRWTVAGTSYLSRLTVGSAASVRAPRGRRLTMTVDGVATPIERGASYAGAIVLSVE